MRIINTDDIEQIQKIMRKIGADKRGIEIMAPKGILRLIRLNNLDCFSANILKQEMLSIGGEVCLSRGTLNGKSRLTDCLVMGTLSQYERLLDKLDEQPQVRGLQGLCGRISSVLKNYQLPESARTRIMGIVNLTPDSFSGDGLLTRGASIGQIIDYARELVSQGADIIDIGGESSRPSALPVSEKEEIKRTAPVIKKLSKIIKVPISVDTYKPEVARQALDSGASIVNDITGLRNRRMIEVLAKSRARVIVMHMKGTPRSMQKNPRYEFLMGEIIGYLAAAIKRAQDSGIDKKRIIVDPGIGFGKTVEHNLEILNSLKELKVLGCPVLVGPSRKSFIGKLLNLPPQQRLSGTLATLAIAVMNGASIVRVHDVKFAAQAVKIADAIRKAYSV
ncbi:MAG: dihydropteroate synthase [Candidatus Omnitrophota bacterium]